MAIIDYTQLEPPQLVSYDMVEAKARVISRLGELLPEFDSTSELDPVALVCEAITYEIQHLTQLINITARENLLAFCSVENIPNLTTVERKITQEADPYSIPPKVEILEDANLWKIRAVNFWSSVSYGATRTAYGFFAEAADADVRAVAVHTPTLAVVDIYVLSYSNSGIATPALLDLVSKKIQEKDVLWDTDQITVYPVTTVNYNVSAKIYLEVGAIEDEVKERIIQGIDAYALENYTPNASLPISGLYSALDIVGVRAVEILEPTFINEYFNINVGECGSLGTTTLEFFK